MLDDIVSDDSGDDSDDIDAAQVPFPRERVHEEWGVFQIAPVRATRNVDGVRTKFQIGWGATCGRCRNDGDEAVCKLQRSGTCDRTRRLVAWWLVLGQDCTGPTARYDHLVKCPRPEQEPPSWEELVEKRRRFVGS